MENDEIERKELEQAEKRRANAKLVKEKQKQERELEMQQKTLGSLKYNKIFVLGDSLVDQGAFKGGGWELSKGTALWLELQGPYYNKGETFTNGPVGSKVFADMLNKQSKAGWRFKKFDSFQLRTIEQIGTNYGFGGSKIVPSARSTIKMMGADFAVLNNFSLERQAETLIDHHKRFDRDLIYIVSGSNDLIALANLSEEWIVYGKQLQKEIPIEVVNKMIETVKAIINKLIDKGAKNIVIANIVDISSAPEFKKYLPNQRKVVENLVKKYNSKLDNLIKPKNE